MAGGDLGLGSLEVATSVLLCPYKSLSHSGIHVSSSVNWKELIIRSFSFCYLHRYSREQNIVPAREELQVWRARQGNKREQYGPSVHPLNKFTEYLLCSKNYSAAAAAKSLQLCPTLCDPIDVPPGSPVPGILQAGTLEWVAISFSNA